MKVALNVALRNLASIEVEIEVACTASISLKSALKLHRSNTEGCMLNIIESIIEKSLHYITKFCRKLP